jgi:hypothetical protein
MEAELTVVSIEDEDKEKTPAEWHRHWQKEMSAAQRRTRKYKKQGNNVVARYLDGRAGQQSDTTTGNSTASRLNLFHKNVSTVMSMMYGQNPAIDVSREHHDPDDDIARIAAVLYTRMLDADVTSSGEDLSSVLKACLQDRLLPGMGIARVRYDFATTITTGMNPETLETIETEAIEYEEAPIDYIHWQDVEWGWGRTWKGIPWWGFRSYLTKDEAIERFGDRKANTLDYKNQTVDGDSKGTFGDPEQKDNVQKAEIWEIWNKEDRKVYWYSKDCDLILDVREDPLKLDGFWPHPMPMTANLTTMLYLPKADFVLSQDLYNEIDILQTRIAIITAAVKVVGVYDKSAGDSAGRMLKEGNENDLIPVDNWAMFAEKGGLQGVIQWFPVQEIVTTLQVLDQVQKSKIEQLYEIVGMSDIMRGGSTDQYTSGGTQAIKAKMGSITIQALQDEFARFASDLEQLKAEVISKHFTPQSIVKQSNALYLPEADKVFIGPALELMQSPDVKWRVNIKPESISMIDYAQMKSERTEFLMGMAQFMQSAAPLVQTVPGSLPILLEMLKWSMSGFKGADYLEGTMDQAIEMAKQAPPPGQDDGPSPEELKLELEKMKQQGAQAKQQGEMQKIQAKAQADMQTQQAKIQGEIGKMNADTERDLTLEQTQSQNRLIEIAKELESSIAEIQASMSADIAIEGAQAQMDVASDDNSHDNKMNEIRLQNAGRGTE